VLIFTYTNPLAAGETTIPSLKQVYLDKAADNQHVQAFGDTYDIIAVSQAIQIDGFGDAASALNEGFGEANETNVTAWLTRALVTTVTNASELADALANAQPGDTIELAAGVDFGELTISGTLKDVVIRGAEDSQLKITFAADADLTNVTLTGLDLDASQATYGTQFITIQAGAKADALKITDSTFTGSVTQAIRNGSTTFPIECEDVTFDGQKYSYYNSGAASGAKFENCTFKNHTSWAFLINNEAQSDIVMNGCTFENCKSGIVKCLYGVASGSEFVFTDNTITNSRGHDGKTTEWFWISAASSITASGNMLDGAAWYPGAAEGLGK